MIPQVARHVPQLQQGRCNTPLVPRFPELPGSRSIIRVVAQRVSTSCGYSIPRMAYEAERDTLVRWAERKGPDGIAAYHDEKNRRSIDGLPAL